MPELPEVETIRRGLEPRLAGRLITGVEVRAPKIFVGDPEQLVGQTIVSINRQGKLLIFLFESGQAMTIHLKMTGQLIWRGNGAEVLGGHPEKAYLEPLPPKHTHAIFQFDNRSPLYFNDLPKFGRIRFLS